MSVVGACGCRNLGLNIEAPNLSLHVGICAIDPIELLGGSPQDGRKWSISVVIVSPLRIGLWDPFQMAELHVLVTGRILHVVS